MSSAFITAVKLCNVNSNMIHPQPVTSLPLVEIIVKSTLLSVLLTLTPKVLNLKYCGGGSSDPEPYNNEDVKDRW
jgi:hypothetical protein